MRNRFRFHKLFALAAVCSLLLNGCANAGKVREPEENRRTCYEVFVYSFADGDGDGIGDLSGLTERLSYLNDGKDGSGEDLEITELWLMPVFPSPTYHKYDTTDYLNIDPAYGTLQDFDRLLAACHQRNVKVILDLALNHTSVEHPWFTEHPEYYNFSDEPKTGYAKLSGSDRYYEARFWEGMPDLNLDSPGVREEIEKILEFWLKRGVDGFRLDAVTSYYTEDTGKNVEFLTWLNREVKKQNPDAYLVGECWTGQETYAKYYDSGVDSFFDFAFADQDGIIANVVRGTKPVSYYAKSLEKEEALYKEHNPSYINAPFYTNHDMGRSTGYYAYDDGTRTKFAGALNLLMPGNAFLYYGEELGMKGSGKDENKRAPMQWGENDPMLCAGPPGMDSFEMKFDSLDRQKEDPGSIYHYYKNVLRIRNRFPVIRNGSTHVQDALTTETVCGFTREAEGEDRVLLVINGGEEMEAISLSGTHFTKLSDSLSVSEQKVAMQGDTVILPPFGIAVFEEENND